MPSIQIGKYKRPGIYIEEFDNSPIETPNITGLQTMVIGSSKKGPVNTPITLNSQLDLERIFGDLDRGLESKGSYFHRTISKVLESSPVTAINLLNPDDELDKLEFKSISTSSANKNDVKREGSYRRFFDTSTFWKKDREAFLSLSSEFSGNDKRPIHFTNLDDKEITVFVVKSSNTGYDVTLLEWYGSNSKVPFYLDPKDYASDYLVDVIVLDGNWTNYNVLSVDPRWSRYFNNEGLIKSELFNLTTDVNVNTLYVWRGLSLIPYFRDINNTNIFIEHKINEQTDKTGLYCAFDVDLVETDYRNGLLDIIGNNLISNNEASEIDFLSYKENVTEVLEYKENPIDRPGNTLLFSDDNQYQDGSVERSGLYAEGFVAGLTGMGATSSDGSYPSGVGYGDYTVSYTSGDYLSEFGSYAVIGGQKLELSDKEFTFSPDNFVTSNTTTGSSENFKEVFFIDTDGTIKKSPTNNQLVNGIVLGYIDVVISHDSDRNRYFNSIDYTPVTVDDNGFVYIDSTDIVAVATSAYVTYEFKGTSGSSDINDYSEYRIWKAYNRFAGILNDVNVNRSSIVIEGMDKKVSLSNVEVEITSESNSNKVIKLTPNSGNLDVLLNTSGLLLYINDDEVIFGNNGMITTNEVAGATQGVIGVYSELYQDYIDGKINTGDTFFENLIDGNDNTSENTSFEWIKFIDDSGTDYLVSDKEINFNTNDEVVLPESILNNGVLTITNPNPIDISSNGPLVGLTQGYAYQVSEDVTTETILKPTKILNTSQTHYLRFYKKGDILNISFMDDSLSALSTSYNKTMDINTQDSNFRQTVEVEFPTGYVRPNNVILIDGNRYTEIKVGDFLEAEYDESSLEIGEIPRKMTRVLSKKRYVGDASLLEISCDSSIKLYDYNGDFQTYRFSQIDDYVSSLKGISLSGFRVRRDSMPDGTDDRINDILNIVGKGTPLFNAITDKDIIDFRYLVDSYGLGLTEQSKQTLSDICGKRLDTFGILNMPSMKQFRKSSSPSFVDSEGRLKTEFIALGGDPNSSPAFNYSLAQGDGVSCVGYFTPYVVVNDNGRPREIPPAAWVATTFLRKHLSAITSVTPWTIAAGITDGQVTGIGGLEYSFTGEDIENLNGMSVNPIISKRNRGRVIETENTAQTLVNSALSLIHVREVLIELERELSDMLLNFQWKYNTPEIRAEIKLRADVICENYVNRNGLFNFFNKIDSENNTSEIIDNQMGVLDTYIEPIKGMSIIVNNITILKTGSIDSGGFN